MTNSLPHYYNHVLSRLNLIDNFKLIVLIPSKKGLSVGEGVYQTRDGVNFEVYELPEIKKFKFITTFFKLNKFLKKIRPDVIITIEDYLKVFVLDPSIKYTVKKIGCKLILKSIPFRYFLFSDALIFTKSNTPFLSLSHRINFILIKFHLIRLARYLALLINKAALMRADAHVNYIEAYEFWNSYDIPNEKIFITRNSPDTEKILSTQRELKNLDPILPRNPYRIIHVGRLVEWKRVDLLIKAFSHFRKKYEKAELLIVGEGPDMNILKELATNLNLDGSVNFVGGCYDQRLLGQYYLSSSLYVLAGMGGLSINEAMAYGLPILCSVCDGTEKFLVREGLNGHFFIEGNLYDLSKKMLKMHEDVDKLSRMGEASRRIIKDEVNIATVIDGYKKAIQYVNNLREPNTPLSDKK